MRAQCQRASVQVQSSHSLIGSRKVYAGWLCAENAQILPITHQGHKTRVEATPSSNKDTPGNADPADPWEAA